MIKSNTLIEIAKQYGTPVYVYDLDLIRKRYREIYNFIKWPRTRVFYAMKANYNLHILKMLEHEGAYIDTVSPAEVFMAEKAGFKTDQLLYTANNIKSEEMHEVRKKNVIFNIGSLSRLDKFGRDFPGARVCIRFNPDVIAGSHENIQTGGNLTKFGILLEHADVVVSIARKYNLKVVGLHEHTGSGIAEEQSVYTSMKNLLGIARPELFPDLEFIDFGGGFKVPYSPLEKRIDYHSFGRNITAIFEQFCKDYGRELYMYFEPGKFIVAESGHLLIRVNTMKNNRGRLIAGTDSGFNQLIRPMYYGAYHHIQNLTNPDGAHMKYDICGNICETGDCFARDRILPEVREGDILDIENAGAYCYSQGSYYNMRPMPPEVTVDRDKVMLSRRRYGSADFVERLVQEYE